MGHVAHELHLGTLYQPCPLPLALCHAVLQQSFNWWQRLCGRLRSICITGTQCRHVAVQEERFNFDETLTGFKWLGNRAVELQQAGFTPLFAFEEAIGFMFAGSPGGIKDKDGVAAAVIFAEMAADLQQWGIGVAQHLNSLRDLYGFFEVRSSYFLSDRPQDIRGVFERLRQGGTYPKVSCSVAAVVDLNTAIQADLIANHCLAWSTRSS